MPYQMLFDSCNDLGPTYEKDHEELTIIPLAYEINGKRYRRFQDDRELPVDDFYKYQSDKIYGKTAQVTPNDFITYAKPFLEKGKDVFIMPFSSGLSGTYQSGVVATGTLKEEFPDRTIVIYDSLAAATCYSAMIEEAERLYQSGMPIEEMPSRLDAFRKHLHTWFAVNDLGALVHGGRVSKAKGFFAGVFSIKPILILDKEGKLDVVDKGHGTKKALEGLVEAMKKDITEEGKNHQVYVSYGADKSLLDTVIDLAKKKISPSLKFVEGRISPVIGVHTGPSIICLTWYGSDKQEK